MPTAADIGREIVAEAGPVIVGIGAGLTAGWIVAVETGLLGRNPHPSRFRLGNLVPYS